MLVEPVLSGPYANIAEKNKMCNVKKNKEPSLTKFMAQIGVFFVIAVKNKKGEGCCPFTFLRREISPA